MKERPWYSIRGQRSSCTPDITSSVSSVSASSGSTLDDELVDKKLAALKAELLQQIEYVEEKAGAANKELSSQLEEYRQEQADLQRTTQINMATNHSEIIALLNAQKTPGETPDRRHVESNRGNYYMSPPMPFQQPYHIPSGSYACHPHYVNPSTPPQPFHNGMMMPPGLYTTPRQDSTAAIRRGEEEASSSTTTGSSSPPGNRIVINMTGSSGSS